MKDYPKKGYESDGLEIVILGEYDYFYIISRDLGSARYPQLVSKGCISLEPPIKNITRG